MSEAVVESAGRQAEANLVPPKSWQSRMEDVARGMVFGCDVDFLFDEIGFLSKSLGAAPALAAAASDWLPAFKDHRDLAEALRGETAKVTAKRLAACGRLADAVEDLRDVFDVAQSPDQHDVPKPSMEVVKILDKIVEWSWEDEKAAYIRSTQAKRRYHYFTRLVTLANWLHNGDATPEQCVIRTDLEPTDRRVRQYAVDSCGCDAYSTDEDVVHAIDVAAGEGRVPMDDILVLLGSDGDEE